MRDAVDRDSVKIALRVGRRADRGLLAGLFTDYEVVDIAETVPDGTDICIVDDSGLTAVANALTAWKRDQQLTYAPALLLPTANGTDPWEQYAGQMGRHIDAIQPIPTPSRVILARVESLLEKRQYSKELVKERQLIEQIFDTSPIAKIVLDTDGNILRGNQRAEEVLGLSSSELTGRVYDDPDWRIIDENGDAIPSTELPFEQAMRSGEPVYGYEHGIEHPDGTRVWLSINMGPVYDESGEIDYLVSSIEDITESKRLERELRESEELHRTTLSNITDTVFITDSEGKFTYICPNVHFLFGYTKDEVQEMGTVDVLLGVDPARAGIAAGTVLENIDLQVSDADGDEHSVLVTVTPVSIQSGTRLYSVRDVTELVESERQLELEQERLETVVSNAPLILLAINDDGIITLSKGRQLERIGFAPGEMDTESIFEVFEGNQAIRETVDRLLEGIEVTTELRIRDQFFKVWTQPIFENGTVTHGIIVAQDITNRKRRENRFRAFVEGSSDIITVFDNDGVVEYVSPSIERILGHEPDSLIGSDVLDIIHPADRNDVVKTFNRISEVKETTSILERHRMRHANGSWRWMESRATKHPELPRGMYVVNTRDVTEQVRADTELRKTQRAVESTGHAIYILDVAGDIEYVNPAFEEITGYTKEEVIGRKPRFVKSGKLSEEYYAELWESIETSDVGEAEVVNERKDGTQYHAVETMAPITGPSGDIEGYVAIQTDITDQKDRLQQIRVLDRVLRHNLRNDLTIIRGLAEMVGQESGDSKSDYGERIVEHSDNLLNLTTKQRKITEVLSTEPLLESLDVVATIRQALRSVAIDYPEASVSLELPDKAMVLATNDIGRAIEELVTNGIKHGSTGTSDVVVSVTESAKSVNIRIEDSGPGIPEMDMRVVMGEHEIEPLYHGSGLGLWLVSWIIRRSNGRLWFEDNEPRGSVVCITLPKTNP